KRLPTGWEILYEAGATPLDPKAPEEFYDRTWAEPSLDVNGIRGGKPEFVNTTLIVEAEARLTIRLAPGQDLETIADAAEKLIRRAIPEQAEVEIVRENSAPPGVFSPDSPAIKLGLEAFTKALGVRPLLVRVGGTLPIYPALAERGIPTIGTVFATLAGSAGPTVGLLAHMDTSADESGTDVKPQVVRNYDGGDIVLPGDPRKVLRAEDNPILAGNVGHDIVTTDGTTLLGADDKAGVAEIMSAVAYLAAHPEIEHAPIRVGFTVDEETGRGVDRFDIDSFGADFAYTLDGSEIGRIDDENFSASDVRIHIEGHS